ncbi:sulfurtransferase [Microbacterium kunmingense]|uniref:sulfurtransferase n=1 Tax=Microbacterium kunmingense TaxID=2915939 RepID=UPI0020056F58|nr:rhodanese-like domain-containing protein [Microbacterium kunmingense]
MPLLITPHELVSELEAGRSVRLLDVRWRLNLPEGRPGYVSGHLPGAVYVDLERELADPGHPEIGRYPLPRHADLQNSARRWGIRDGDLVVAYDDNDAVSAARAWWLLRHRGLDVRVLDGGIRAWVATGLPVERESVDPLLHPADRGRAHTVCRSSRMVPSMALLAGAAAVCVLVLRGTCAPAGKESSSGQQIATRSRWIFDERCLPGHSPTCCGVGAGRVR